MCLDYIAELRSKVGHIPLVLVGTGVLIFNENEELLMLLRNDNHCWDLPGGMLEPGETLEQAACRETFEEIGLTLQELDFYKVFSGTDLFYRFPNGDEVYAVCVVYIARKVEGKLQVNLEEHSKYGFFPVSQLPGPVSPPQKVIFQDLLNQKVLPR